MLLFHFGTVKTEHLTIHLPGLLSRKQLIIHEMNLSLAVLPAKISRFTYYITDIYFLIIAAFFEDWIEALNLESGGYLNYSLPLISLIKSNKSQSIFISFDFDKISFHVKIHYTHKS